MISWICSHKFTDIIFEITQQLALYHIIKLGQVLYIQLIKGFFWACFVTIRATGQ